MVDIIQRPEWGARYEDGFGYRAIGNLEVYLHHSVTIAPDLVPPFDDDYAAVRTLEQIGEDRFGKGISYHFPISPAGLVFEGVSIDRIGAAISGYNTPTANICLIGNYDVTRPPPTMLEAVDALLHHGVSKKWWKSPRLNGGHQDAPGAQTACPGRYAEALVDDINRGEYHNGSPAPKPAPAPKGDITVDGYWGNDTTSRMQQELGTTVDGVVSSQEVAWRDSNPGLTSGWDWTSKPVGSKMITAHQTLLKERGKYKGDIDGIAGPEYFKGMQRDLGTTVDGHISEQSKAVMALQRRFNGGKI